jgi:hypothetical protein
MHFTRKYKKIEILFILEMNNIYPYNKLFKKHFITMMSMLQQQNDKIKAARRETVMASYNAAKTENTQRFLEGDKKATSEYIYENQKEDAAGIVNEYYINNRRVVSITKKTKVGADGLMIEVAKLMTTHPDDNFVINPANVRILTGMSNASWEKDMKDKAPGCFRGKIFHHGQLKNADLRAMRDSLIIVDELDTGDKECQVLHNVLKAAGVLNVDYMEQNNIRFMFISATMIKELYDLYHWGQLHCLYAMTIPASYIGHADFLARGTIQEFYPVTTVAAASKWIQEDIMDYYGPEDCRIHIIRANLKTSGTIQSECIRRNIPCFNHTSDERIEEEVLRQLFEGSALTRHVVLIVKGFFRRANLIPNDWKLRIGATHEFYTKKVDNNVQIQALPGRMSGYWREIIEAGHKTGPYRTSVQAVQQYEAVYNNPFGENSYQSVGFHKKNGKVTLSTPVFVSPINITGLEKQQKNEEHDKRNVPIVLPLALTEIDAIHGQKTSKKRQALIAILKQYLVATNKQSLAERIDGFEVGQITRPVSKDSRKKNIDEPINAAKNGNPYIMNLNEELKKKDSWQAAFDEKGEQIIFMIYCNP